MPWLGFLALLRFKVEFRAFDSLLYFKIEPNRYRSRTFPNLSRELAVTRCNRDARRDRVRSAVTSS